MSTRGRMVVGRWSGLRRQRAHRRLLSESLAATALDGLRSAGEAFKRIRVMYVVPDLGIGGAERHVTKLMPNLDRSRSTRLWCASAMRENCSAISRPPALGRSHCIAVNGKRSAHYAI